MSTSDSSHRWVATLIVLLLLFQAGNWVWHKYQQFQQEPALKSAAALKQKIKASMAYDTALLVADSLLASADTATAARLLDSLSQQSTDGLFPIERQKLQRLQQRLDSVRALSPPPRR
ncbi:hypothetical protein KBK19_04490 [Microvirga sp. STR05]|uniref:Uncharacterized protein n=1 Tax=Hymenobacter duratus TaxID=2771356 RepID=A0ABR8JFX2_9BACT|nr:hypothetical protein [Hymenobacter duratus]MBD2714287.1 hypothetical protein [Hymenobacter duratus]MBR7949190.1 hypothetical protein [Microvirga sp. STR05]